MEKELRTDFLGVKLSSPLVLPAGVLDISFSSMKQVSVLGAGLVTTKSLSTQARKGHEGPVVTEVEGGMLNAMGLCNPGIEAGIKEVHLLKEAAANDDELSGNCPVNMSIFATDKEDFVSIAEKADKSEADFIELNLSCPNVMDEFGVPLAASEQMVAEIISAVKNVTQKPVIAKLSPNVTNFTKIAGAATDAGADALCMINTLGPGIDIDIEMAKPVLSNITGGMSGPCVKPIALRLVYECRKAGLNIPIIGMGGITNGRDAVQMLMAGADLVGVGTAVYYRGPEVFRLINEELLSYLRRKGLDSFQSINRII
ncbi:MAG: dihydroorotate dehydrogenase [Spirochaetales bacterium]|nr:dihydroorotate dehydrogenase [Spirochaetales bacterium]